jgi:hypothetical protein
MDTLCNTSCTKRMSCNCSGPSNHVATLFNVPNNVLSVGVNDDKIHSEVDAILKLKYRRDKLKHPIKISVLVVRITQTGILGMSKPCLHCVWALHKLPRRLGYVVSDVYYSDKNGEIVKTTMKSLLSGPLHVSRGHQ